MVPIHTMPRTLSSKRSRGSLRSFRSNLGMVGEESTLISTNPGSSSKANSEWNLPPPPHPSLSSGQLSGLRRPPPSSSSSSSMSVQDILLQRQQHLSARTMSGLGAGGAPSRASLSNAAHHSTGHHGHGLTSSASMHRSTSLASLASNASGPISAPKPNNPFLGGGSTSAAANFLSLVGPTTARAAAAQHHKATARTRQTPPSPGQGGGVVVVPPEPSSSSSVAKMHHGGGGLPVSSAAQDFINLLQQPAGIGSVQALIHSQQQRDPSPTPPSASTPGNAADGGLTIKAPQTVDGGRKVQSFVGGCRGSTPRKAGPAALKVTDDGTLVHNGQSALAAHEAQMASTDAADMSPQDLMVKIIQERGGDVTIQPVLSVETKFHEHTAEEIAAYPPTAMLVRNNDLPGLKMAHRSGTKLQTSNKFGESLLHIACRRGYDDIARYLLEEAGATVWVRDDFGRTPCHDACWTAKPNLELMDLLVRRCPEMLLMSDKRGSTPLDYVRRDNWDVWRNFLSDRWDIICPGSNDNA
mmetsp:Transcript_30773/g.89888  ORF Transcript_30773/g.89888 Transcript_30773/m.89888 type:complete len:526 (-) Transcript_30773:16-1593(-)